jgi:hypothetical protein
MALDEALNQLEALAVRAVPAVRRCSGTLRPGDAARFTLELMADGGVYSWQRLEQ